MSRRTLYLAGIGALLAFDPAGGAQAGASGFVAPGQPVVLTRTVHRSLHDGNEVVARRSYRLRFTTVDGGYHVDATLIDVAVDAPPPLALLAALEQQRTDTASFSLQLDQHGMIVAESGAVRTETQGELSQLATAQLRSATIDPETRRQAIDMLGQILAASAGSGALPVDLFNPTVLDSHERRRVALPGSGVGEVEIDLAVQRGPGGALPQHFERTVTTELGGTRKVTREEYELRPA